MSAQWDDPGFAAKASERSRETMTRLNADSQFRTKATEAARDWMTQHWQSPESAKHAAVLRQALTRKWDDPEFAAKASERSREVMTRLNADPEFRAASRAGNSATTKKRWAEYRARKAQLNAEDGNEKGTSVSATETPQRQHRARGHKRAMILTPDK